MTDLYNLPKDILIKLIIEIQVDERLKFYKRWASQDLKWENFNIIINSIIEDSNNHSVFLLFFILFPINIFQHFMTLENQNKYLLPNVKNTQAKNWSEICAYFDSNKYIYCEKCNSLYLGKEYKCDCQVN